MGPICKSNRFLGDDVHFTPGYRQCASVVFNGMDPGK